MTKEYKTLIDKGGKGHEFSITLFKLHSLFGFKFYKKHDTKLGNYHSVKKKIIDWIALYGKMPIENRTRDIFPGLY